MNTRSQTMAQLAAAFSRLSNTGMSLNRPIVDRTGLIDVLVTDHAERPTED